MKPLHLSERAAAGAAAVAAVALLAAAALAGCGSSDNDRGRPAPGTPAPVIDAFFAAVSGIVSTSSETTEGNTIDALSATVPEGVEPERLD